MRFFREPLPRYRELAAATALFAALWLALPALKALAVPPDNGPIQGSATAVQDPPGNCSGADTVRFAIGASILDNIFYVTDPAGGASGPLNADNTAHLTGAQETYDLQSIQGTTLIFSELYGGCSYRTTVVLDRVLFPVVTTPPPTQTNETASQPTVSGTPAIVIFPSSGGHSGWWLWAAGAAGGVALMGGGWWYYYYYYYSARGGAPPEPEGFDPVPPTDGSGEEGDDRQEIG